MANVLVLNEANWEAEVLQSPVPVLVDFWAPWCGPCRVLGPVIARVSTELRDRALVGKLDVDSSPAIKERYQVKALPCLMVFVRGEKVAERVGIADMKTILAMVP